jgi:hypothetical protein
MILPKGELEDVLSASIKFGILSDVVRAPIKPVVSKECKILAWLAKLLPLWYRVIPRRSDKT